MPEQNLAEHTKNALSRLEAEFERLTAEVRKSRVKIADVENDNDVEAEVARISFELTRGLSCQVAGLENCLWALSTHRSQSFTCQLPNQPAHSNSKVDQCIQDPKHKFCRYHNLDKCVIDGHDLVPLP
jgi:hypothetical protein